MIAFENLQFFYQSHAANGADTIPIVNNLSTAFSRGKVHALIGLSGCGKTTLMYLMAGLLRPSSGKVLINGEVVVPGREKTGVILQDHGLFPWKSVISNLSLGLKLRGYPKGEIRKRVELVSEEMGFSSGYLENRFPTQLSGGERQRLAIGRALVLDPDLLLLDEPFSSLDAMTRERLQDHLWNLQQSRSATNGGSYPQHRRGGISQ